LTKIYINHIKFFLFKVVGFKTENFPAFFVSESGLKNSSKVGNSNKKSISKLIEITNKNIILDSDEEAALLIKT
jgi:pseudouridine-5'-phosphate glycosidase